MSLTLGNVFEFERMNIRGGVRCRVGRKESVIKHFWAELSRHSGPIQDTSQKSDEPHLEFGQSCLTLRDPSAAHI